MADWSAFNSTDASYKEIDGQNIELSILSPKEMKPGRHPVIVRFHGGFLVTGSRLYPRWFQQWIIDLALRHQAILITPDYRLMPEASGSDVLSDMASFFHWMRNELPFLLSNLGVEADLTSILVTGESAGGYLAVQSALLNPNSGIKAVISAYGVLDIKSRFFLEKFEKVIVGAGTVAEHVLDDHLQQIKERRTPLVVTAGVPPERMDLTLCVVQAGRFVEFLGDDSALFPMENLERRKDGEVPAMWIFHGTEDTAVPAQGSQVFADKVKALHPSTELLLTLHPGGEHGFDRETPLDEEWLKTGLEFVAKHWP